MSDANTIKLLEKLVSIPSEFPSEARIGAFLEAELRRLGFKVRRQQVASGRFNVLAEKGEGKALLFYGHMDTVPTASGWQAPFKPRRQGDRLIGLGACDMKGGIAAVLSAAEGIDPEGYKLKIAFGVDEENISAGADELVRSGWLSDVIACIVPETGSPAINRYQNEGEILIGLGRRGRIPVQLRVMGRSAHAASPSQGVSAAEDAAKIIGALEKLPLKRHKLLGNETVCVLSINCSAKGLSVPDECTIIVDRHIVPPNTLENVLRDIRRLVDGLHLHCSVEVLPVKRATPFLLPYAFGERNSLAQFVVETAESLGLTVGFGAGLSVADENYFAVRSGIPTLTIGPIGGNDHAPDEWVGLASLGRVRALFRELILSFPF